MNRYKKAGLAFLMLASLLAVWSAGPAARTYASPPEFHTFTVDDTFVVTDFCSFSVERHIEGTVRIATFYDANGNPTRQMDQLHFTDTITANGNTLNINDTSGVIRSTIYPDGSVVVYDQGPRLYVVPGSGFVLGSAGRDVIRYNPDGSVDILQSSGISRADRAAVCAYLAQ